MYRVNYTAEQWQALSGAVRQRQLSPRDRMGLQNDVRGFT
jgi:hypothetical protein